MRTTTAILDPKFERPVSGQELVGFQRLVRRVPVAEPVMPTPREASTVAGSTELTPAYVEVRIGGMARITSATTRGIRSADCSS